MQQTLLLLSEGRKSLHRFGFLFEKPPSETQVVCITTAINPYEQSPWWDSEQAVLRQLGFPLTDYDLAGKEPAAVEQALRSTDIIYVTGGNTYYLMEKINQSDFAAIAKQRLSQGALYIGSSAGTVVACPDIAFIEDMDNPSAASLTHHQGMGLVDFSILPHMDHPGFGDVARAIAAKAEPHQRLIGLRDDQGIVMRGSYAEVY